MHIMLFAHSQARYQLRMPSSAGAAAHSHRALYSFTGALPAKRAFFRHALPPCRDVLMLNCLFIYRCVISYGCFVLFCFVVVF